MQINNSPRFVKSFMIGLIASSAGAFVALPGAAMPEPGEAVSADETIETVGEGASEGVLAKPSTEALQTPEAGAETTDGELVVEEGTLDDTTPVAGEELDTPVAGEELDTPVAGEELDTPVAGEELDTPVVDEGMDATEPVAGEEATEPVAEEINTEEFTITELTTNSDSFEVLAAALDAAELTETLGSEGPFTVFAPTDEAFAELPEGAVEQLLLPENKDILVQVLSYHVVPTAVLSDTLESGPVETVEGSEISVEVGEDAITVDNANVVLADVEASNGVIHIIDRVILPPAPEADAEIEDAETPEAADAELEGAEMVQ